MLVRSVATALAGARIATAIVCAVSVSLAAGSAALPFDATSLFIVVAVYGFMALGSLLAAVGRAETSRAGALAMTLWDCAFLAIMIAIGETGALALPLAVLIMRARSADDGERARPWAPALVVASFVAAAALSPFWSTHAVLVLAVAAMLIAAAAPARRTKEAPVAAREAGAHVAAEEEPVTASEPPGEAGPLLAPRRILIADPVTTSRLILEKILAHAGHTAVGVADGAKALQMLGAQSAPFDVLLVDGELPDMNGAALTRSYRANETRSPLLRIIGLEAAHTPLLAAAGLDAGMDATLAKPVNFAALLDLIADAASSAPAFAESLEPAAAFAAPVASDASVPTEAVAEPATEAASEGPAIDLRALRDLESLGGPEFVREIVNQFIVDGAGALRNLARLTVDRDVEMFRDQAHALRSSAANVGARGIYETCLSWRAIAPEQLARDGAGHMRTLSRQFQEATAVLEDYIARLGEGADGDGVLASAKIPDAA